MKFESEHFVRTSNHLIVRIRLCLPESKPDALICHYLTSKYRMGNQALDGSHRCVVTSKTNKRWVEHEVQTKNLELSFSQLDRIIHTYV